VNLLAELAAVEQLRGNMDGALRLAVRGARLGLDFDQRAAQASPVSAELAAAVAQSGWRLVLSGHEKPVFSAAFSPDLSRIITASGDMTARIWDAATGKEMLVLHGHEDTVRSAGFSPDGSRILTASADKTARIWDAATGKQMVVLHGHAGELRSAA